MEDESPGTAIQSAAVALGACCLQIGTAAVDALTACGTCGAGEGAAADACVAERPPPGLPVTALLLNRLAWTMSLVMHGEPGVETTDRPSGDGLRLSPQLVSADVRCAAMSLPLPLLHA